MEKKHLLVISIDSMVQQDIALFKKMPNFHRILEGASIVERMESTYPTLTHSIHASIFTGCYPERHGVINNEQFIPGTGPGKWFEKSSLLKVPSLPDIAKKYGYKTACVYWPLTLGADLPWVLHRAGIHADPDNMLDIVRERSTPGLLDEVLPAAAPCWEYKDRYRRNDLFACLSSAYLIRTYQPDILYTHLTLIDHTRHVAGVFSDQIKPAYEILDKGIGYLLEALEETGLLEKTMINITSDHGHMDIDRVVSINRFFADHGLLQMNERGEVSSYRAYCHSASLSAQIYVMNHDSEIREETVRLLAENRRVLGISEIIPVEECRERFHTDGDYDFMIETDGETSFSAQPHFPLITLTDNSDYRTSSATHGHQPWKGAQPAFILKNPFSNHRVVLPEGRMVDQAPTLARLLGFEMELTDGEVLVELVE